MPKLRGRVCGRPHSEDDDFLGYIWRVPPFMEATSYFAKANMGSLRSSRWIRVCGSGVLKMEWPSGTERNMM